MSAVPSHSGYLKPKISVDRATRSIAIFDGLECVRNFQPYADESVALTEAHEWLKTRTVRVPQVVFPLIRKIKFSS